MPWTNLGQAVSAAAAGHRERVAFRIQRGLRAERITFDEAELAARRMVSLLRGEGVGPGSRVALWAPNMPEYAMGLLGIWMAGAVSVPIDLRTSERTRSAFLAAAQPVVGLRSRFSPGALEGPMRRTIDLEDLPGLLAGQVARSDLPSVGRDDLAQIAFTSGTTGVPKGVEQTHGNFLHVLEHLPQVLTLKPGDRALSLLPLSHAFAQVIDLLYAFSSGVQMTYVPRLNSVTIAREMRRSQVTELALVPQVLRLLLDGIEQQVAAQGKQAQWEKAHRLAERLPNPLRRLLFSRVHRALGGHLRFVGVGSAPLDLNVARAWERMGVRVIEGYGATETTALLALNTLAEQRLGSVGRPLPGVEVRIADDGEVLARGPSISRGYFKNPELTAQVFRDDWYHTADYGYLDADGFLHLRGRAQFRIVLANGQNVYPEDIERELSGHPLVREAVVVGVRRPRGEAVHAAIIAHEPDKLEEIVRQANAQIEAHQQIMEYSAWPEDDFPRTPLFKVDRRQVLARLEERLELTVDDEGRPPLPSPPHAGGNEGGPADRLIELIARVAELPLKTLSEEQNLGADLNLDSLGRIELLAALEDELGLIVDDTQVTPQTTVADLRRLTQTSAPTAQPREAPAWPRGRLVAGVRELFQDLGLFRIQDRWLDIRVQNPEALADLPRPALLVFNYAGPYAALVILRVLPSAYRHRTVVAADDRLWKGRDRYQGFLAQLVVNGYPFAKGSGAARTSLAATADLLDRGWSVIVAPEGEPELEGELLPLLPGTGLMAVELGVPVVPFKLDGYYELFPKYPEFPYLPNQRGPVCVCVGAPLRFPRDADYQKATQEVYAALAGLRCTRHRHYHGSNDDPNL